MVVVGMVTFVCAAVHEPGSSDRVSVSLPRCCGGTLRQATPKTVSCSSRTASAPSGQSLTSSRRRSEQILLACLTGWLPRAPTQGPQAFAQCPRCGGFVDVWSDPLDGLIELRSKGAQRWPEVTAFDGYDEEVAPRV